MIQKHFVVICLVLALVLLSVAALLYPGGSQASLQSVGFSLADNYLCNLFGAKAMNGADNPGRFWAFAGMFLMCVGFGAFFYRASAKIQHRSSALIIRYTGMASMFFAFLVITPYHDLMVTIMVVSGMVAVFYLSVFVFRMQSWFWGILTAACLALVYFDTFLYYSGLWLEILPGLQKINYILTIVWVIGIEYFTTRDDFPVKMKSTKAGK
jgi:hypothetical protein